MVLLPDSLRAKTTIPTIAASAPNMTSPPKIVRTRVSVFEVFFGPGGGAPETLIAAKSNEISS
jgi:hypothetical protein